MAVSDSSQKFIGRNRPPRVQIEYDVELYGSEKKVNLPFVMGVMSNLSGKSEKEKLVDRKFLEFDIDNFQDRMAAIKPKASFRVPNTLTGEGEISVDLDFASMDDFKPDKVAEKVDALKQLLKARKELSALISYMDGKDKAENLIADVLKDPALLKSLSEEGKKMQTESEENEASDDETGESKEDK